MVVVHTFGCEKFLLRGRLVVHAVESKGELFGFVLRARYPHESVGLGALGAGCCHDDVLIQLLREQRTDSRDDPDRHDGGKGGRPKGIVTWMTKNGQKDEKVVIVCVV